MKNHHGSAALWEGGPHRCGKESAEVVWTTTASLWMLSGHIKLRRLGNASENLAYPVDGSAPGRSGQLPTAVFNM